MDQNIENKKEIWAARQRRPTSFEKLKALFGQQKKMKNKETWRPMSILVEHDLHVERLSREWKESTVRFSFWETTETLLMAWVKFAFCTGSRLRRFCREVNRRKRLAVIKVK